MRLALRVLKYLVGIVVVLLAAGFLLPSNYSAQRSVTINAPAEKVFPLVVNQKEWKRCSVWNQRDPSMQMTYSCPEMAAGSKWSWKSKSEGNRGLEFSAVERNKRIGYALTMEDMKPATGDLTLTPDDAGTRVRWNINGSAHMNLVFRWFRLITDTMIEPDFKGGPKNLKKLVESI